MARCRLMRRSGWVGSAAWANDRVVEARFVTILLYRGGVLAGQRLLLV